jgi:hypothetical protein
MDSLLSPALKMLKKKKVKEKGGKKIFGGGNKTKSDSSTGSHQKNKQFIQKKQNPPFAFPLYNALRM